MTVYNLCKHTRLEMNDNRKEKLKSTKIALDPHHHLDRQLPRQGQPGMDLDRCNASGEERQQRVSQKLPLCASSPQLERTLPIVHVGFAHLELKVVRTVPYPVEEEGE